MLYGLDALAHGATAALIALPPLIWLFWWLTALLGAGARALRPFVACCAAYGFAVAVAGTWAINFERAGYADEAVAGALIGGGIFALIAFLILLALPRRKG
jgi:hypothetical protein